MPDEFDGNGVILPNRPWANSMRRTGEHARLARTGEFGAIGVAMIALFACGWSLGADGDLDPLVLMIGTVGSALAFCLPWLMAHVPHPPAPGPGQPGAFYSETTLLGIWPVRRRAAAEGDTTFDTSGDRG